MTKAQEMVQLAEKFRETLASKGGDSESLDPEMQRQLIDMGIASPVTKDTAGAQYHQQLSRQVTACSLHNFQGVSEDIWIQSCSTCF